MKYNFLVKSTLLVYNRARKRLWNSAIRVTFFFWEKGSNAGEFNRHLELENESLREENDMLSRMLFGKKSEKIVCEKIGIEEEEQPPHLYRSFSNHCQKAGQKQPTKKKRHLKATVTKEIEQLVIPDEVQQNPSAYVRL